MGMVATGGSDWWRGAVIYQIYPRSFADSNQDGVGDLPGIFDKLDYIASLGVDGFWISPFFTSPMADFGYDVSDYRDVDPIFGTLADFDRIVERAHRLGLKVIIDQIYSHTSDQHPWFVQSRAGDRALDPSVDDGPKSDWPKSDWPKSDWPKKDWPKKDWPKKDWYVWADARPDGSPPTNWMSFFYGPAWTWDARRGQYYLHNFLPSQPDLNLWNQEVRAAIADTLRFWLARGVDGVRLDAISHCLHDLQLRDNPPRNNPHARKPGDMQEMVHTVGLPQTAELMGELRSVLDEFGARFALGEIGGADPLGQAITYADQETTLQTYYSFTFLFQKPLSARLIRQGLEEALRRHPKGWPTQVFSNHDAVRVVSRWGEARPDFSQMLNLLLFCLRGSVCLYQGEELGLPQADVPFERLQDPEAIENWPHTMGRDGARTPMPWGEGRPHAGFSSVEPWLPVDPRHGALSVEAQEKDPQSTLQFTRAALALRQSEAALRLGDIAFVDTEEPVLAFIREHEGRQIFCAFNLSGEGASFAFSDAMAPLGGWSSRAALRDGTITLAPFGFLLAEASL
jgi:alpha-glucosidase